MIELAEEPPAIEVTRERIVFYDSQVAAIIRFVRLCETMPIDRAWRLAMGEG